jgi:hypothetical protein
MYNRAHFHQHSRGTKNDNEEPEEKIQKYSFQNTTKFQFDVPAFMNILSGPSQSPMHLFSYCRTTSTFDV